MSNEQQPKPMTSEQMEAAQKMAKTFEGKPIGRVIDSLLAEVRRLKAEAAEKDSAIEELHGYNKRYAERADEAEAEVQRQQGRAERAETEIFRRQAEIDRLQAENDQLRQQVQHEHNLHMQEMDERRKARDEEDQLRQQLDEWKRLLLQADTKLKGDRTDG